MPPDALTFLKATSAPLHTSEYEYPCPLTTSTPPTVIELAVTPWVGEFWAVEVSGELAVVGLWDARVVGVVVWDDEPHPAATRPRLTRPANTTLACWAV